MPRAGSTLLQRILMSHPDIHSVSEPWLLLPLAYLMPDYDGMTAPYNHFHAQVAIKDLINNLPQKKEDYYTLLSTFVQNVYQKLSPENGHYFLDKTPRYYLIIPFIEKLFPDAKFIFLFRNPLSVLASIIETWGDGRIKNLHVNHIDIYKGPMLLVEGWKRLQNKSIKVSYEDLVVEPEMIITKILKYLNLEFNSSQYEFFNNKNLNGKMGDKTGIKKYSGIDTGSLQQWEQTFNTKFRVWFAAKYIKKIGASVLKDMGYSHENILSELKNVNFKNKIGIGDTIDFVRTVACRRLTGNLLW